MTEVFVLQNQNQLFLSKQNEWVDGREPQSLFKCAHKDEALNQLIEVNSKDYQQRIKIVSCPANPKGVPELAEDILPPPIPKQTELDTGSAADDENDDTDVTPEGNSEAEAVVN